MALATEKSTENIFQIQNNFMNDPHKPRIFSGPGTIGSAHKIVSGGGSPKANNGVQHYKSIKTQPSFTKDETTAGASLE